MKAVIKKWGNSLGIRIPKVIVNDLSLKDGTIIEIDEQDDKIILYTKKQYLLDNMLEKITNNNLHSEIISGKSTGNEIW
jgi:antitoxin MazE